MRENKCECGSERFYIVESSVWSAEMNNGKMEAFSQQENGVDKIACKECDKEVHDDIEVEFC